MRLISIRIYRQRRIQVYPLHRIRMEPIVRGRVVASVPNYRITTFPFHRRVFPKQRCPRYHLIRRAPFIQLWARLPTYHNPLFPSRVYRAVSLPADRPTLPSGPMLLAHRACLQVTNFFFFFLETNFLLRYFILFYFFSSKNLYKKNRSLLYPTLGTTSTGLLQAISDPLQAMQQLSAQSQANQLQQQAIIQQIQQSLRASSPTAPSTTGHHFLGSRQMPKIPSSILSNPLDRLTNDNIVAEGQVDMLDIPGKGRCYVYIARFTYEPFQHSPNENPEAELPVQGGDYLLVWGQPDEDGFLDAETLDGRRGLVPVNFVQKLIGDDLLEFHQAVLGLRDVDDSASTNIPQVSNVRLLG